MSNGPVKLTMDALGRLVLAVGAESHVGVTPLRCFPLTDPNGWIAFVDGAGHEVFELRSPDALDPASREVLAAELAQREFIPEIRRIHEISAGAEPTSWHVETDRGETRFNLPSEDNVRRLGDGALVTDEFGIRYRIVDLRALDRSSRRLMGRYL